MSATFPLPGLPHDVLLALPLHRADGPVQAALCVAGGPALREQQHAFLHPRERERAAAMISDKRIGDFLLGRYACKRAIAQLAPEQDPRALCIGGGIFGQPLVQSDRYLGLQVSISHGGGIGAALATPEGHPMALDVEHYAASSAEAIATQLSAGEVALLASTGLGRVAALTVLWAMKEALSKILRCGLMVPFTLLELDRFERSGPHVTGWFRHFAQYRAVAIDLGTFTCAVALPRASHGLALDALADAFSIPVP